MKPRRRNPIVATLRVVVAIIPMLAGTASAAPPDLTAGEAIPSNLTTTWNLGPTGMRGWVYYDTANGGINESLESRQIEVRAVDAGSPAAGVFQANDLILGASGTAAAPALFSIDARRGLAEAIADAEAQTPAELKLIRWRAGVQDVVTLTLRTMGAYTATAPYNCPKSEQILEEGMDYYYNNESSGNYRLGVLSLLAAQDSFFPASDRANYLQKAETEARALIQSSSSLDALRNYTAPTSYPIPWNRAHELIVLGEYYLITGDSQVLPTIEALAINLAKGASHFGTIGHSLPMGGYDASNPYRPANTGYGVINSVGMPALLGVQLAKQCGVSDPAIDKMIDNAKMFYASYAKRGAIPYGEHEAYDPKHENNGKCGLAAIVLDNDPAYEEQAEFFAMMALASGDTDRDVGHTGAFFNYLWAPMGVQRGGPSAVQAYFKEVSWMLDLHRRWDGGFDYDSYSENRAPNGNEYYTHFRMSSAMLLTYALPLESLHITGRDSTGALALSAGQISDCLDAEDYDATARTTAQLVGDLGAWSPKVRLLASTELGGRSVDTATRDDIRAKALDVSGSSRYGAIQALGQMDDTGFTDQLVSLLNDNDGYVRTLAAKALQLFHGSHKLPHRASMMNTLVSRERPAFPADPGDPLQFDQAALVANIFGGGAFANSRSEIDTLISEVGSTLFFDALKVASRHPTGNARGKVNNLIKVLTPAEVNLMAPELLDMVAVESPADRMFSLGVRNEAMLAMARSLVAEAVPAAMQAMDNSNGWGGFHENLLNGLVGYDGSSTLVTPDPDVESFAQRYLTGGTVEEAQALLDAIAADPNPAPLFYFKSIASATADASVVTLPASTTTLRVTAADLAQGDSTYTWTKISGPGAVTFTPNGTAAAANSTLQFDGTAGIYQFQVTMSDSRGLTEAYQTVTVQLVGSGGSDETAPIPDPLTWASAPAPVSGGPVVHEGFDYTSGSDLTGNGGTGFGGSWTVSKNNGNASNFVAGSPGMSFTDGSANDLPASGNRAIRSSATGRSEANRLLSSAARTALLADGSTMWFSVLHERAEDVEHAGFILGEGTFDVATGWELGDYTAGAEGFGFGSSGDQWIGAVGYDDSVGLIKNNSAVDASATRLIVGKVEWNANGSNDTLSLYSVSDLTSEPTTPIATVTADLDQAGFDRISLLSNKASAAYDEIRLGTSFASVAGEEGSGGTSITMTATTASDPSGVEYYFTCTSGNGNDSGWQDSPVYTDTGLTPGTLYTYTVIARDKSANQNTTAPSVAASATTTGTPPGSTVPNVVNQTQSAAESAITSSGFTVGSVTMAASSTVPAGSVISQDPAGGVSAPLGSPVDFVVSLGDVPQDIMSVNFYAYGGLDPADHDKVTLEAGETAGLGSFNVGDWENFQVPFGLSSPMSPVTITSTQGATATFTLNDVRNGGPYAGGTPHSNFPGDGNGDLMDGHCNATEDPYDDSQLFDMEVTGIPYTVYDLIVYIGSNAAQFGDGTGKIVLNGGAEQDFTLPAGEFAGFAEITNGTTPGNYIVFSGLRDASLSLKVWGNGFNHIGPTGFQIVKDNSGLTPPGPASNPGPVDGTVGHPSNTDLSWTAGVDATSRDVYFGTNPNPGAGEFQGNQIGTTFDPGTLANGTYYWRVDEVNADGTTPGPVWSFSVGSPAKAFRPMPWNGMTAVSPNVGSLSWVEGESASAVTHDVYFGTDATPDSGEFKGNQAGTIYVPGALSPGTTYYWRVDQVNAQGTTTGDVWSFTTPISGSNKVKVFILAGQSNTEGHGEMNPNGTPGTLESMYASDPVAYAHLKSGGSWAVRDDAWISYKRGGTTQLNGGLSAGYGAKSSTIGPELQFGHAMADAYSEDVLLIKTAWGGKSLRTDFRPPSSGWSKDVPITAGDEGFYYQEMLDAVVDAMANIASNFPGYNPADGYEIVGFGWHQGWNDRVSPAFAAEYEANMVNFIQDVRASLGVPNLPFVIATTGMDGNPDYSEVELAQLQMENFTAYPQFDGNVAVTDTQGFWFDVASSPADQGYHWNRNAESYYKIGESMAAEMAALLSTGPGPDTTPPVPNPASFASAPSAVSSTSISMTSTTGSDASGPVEYLFTETSGNPGGTSSGWQSSPSYTDIGLNASTQYTYTVTMRDAVGNTGSASAGASATTQATADTTPPTPNPASFASAPIAVSSTSISMTATTGSDPSGVEYLFTETSGNPGATSSGWQSSPSYTDNGLSASTQYTYTVTMRDGLGNTGNTSSAASVTTTSGGGGGGSPSVLAFSEGVGSGGEGDITIATAYDASAADKLVVVLGAEHGWPGNTGGFFYSVSYRGTALTQVVQEAAGVPTAAVFYLDNPGTAGDIVVNQANHNGSIYAIYQLTGTAAGVGSSSKATADSVSLTTTGNNSLVIAGVLDAGPDGGNGAPNLAANAPLSEDTVTDLYVGSRWSSMSTGSAVVASAGPGTYSFSNAGGTDLLAAVAVEFLTDGSPPSTVTVPNVVGLSQSAAQSAITSASLTVGNVTTQESSSVPAGDVISQNPAGGSSVASGTAVNLVVSLGANTSPKLLRTTVNAVSSTSWTTVSLGQTYNSAVIVATPIYPDNTTPSVATRIRNVTGSGFDLKIDRADGLSGEVTLDVSVVAVDEGVYTVAEDGVKMEAVKFTSTVTSRKGNWVGELRSYQNSYTTPVVVGQVMSANDPDWSAFWSMGATKLDPADAVNLGVGKHVAEDADTTRADETIGYIVIEQGSGSIEGVAYEAAVGADTVEGPGNSATPYSYSLSGGLSSAGAAAVSISGMDGNNGAWGVLAGNPAFTASSIGLYALECQMADTERWHTNTQMSYIVFE